MRTGIIHLTGLAAILLFALTVIAWVDAQFYSTAISFDKGGVLFGAFNDEEGLAVWRQHISESTKPLMWMTHRNAHPKGNEPEPEIPMQLVFDWLGFTIAWADPSIKYTLLWELRVPHWFIATCAGAHAFLYLRFLRRRKRHPSVDDGSASSDESDASTPANRVE